MANLMKRVDALIWIRNPENAKKDFAVRFKKLDGSIRLMHCRVGVDDGSLSGAPVKVRPGVVNVYDMDKKEYRSFREDTLMAIEINSVWYDMEEARVISGKQTK